MSPSSNVASSNLNNIFLCSRYHYARYVAIKLIVGDLAVAVGDRRKQIRDIHCFRLSA